MREEGWIFKCDWMEEKTTDVIAERELEQALFPNGGQETARFAPKRPIQITNPWSTGARQEFVTETVDPEYPCNPKHFSVALFHFGRRNLSSE
ncbi:hypothetical protein CEXT_7671 [Caerostris extrusa]|uniref:Uncharacterized protein n=1 Tax=Caerostris extrusa TaxID=172846 RepID=A0AAV4XTK9_CAEEX|nr:hypothetical protein CEXT_7671 [Caerostris extrusa]